MHDKQLQRIKNDAGFIAALDQSGGSTPKALAAYGIGADAYKDEAEMFDLVHEMRTRIITSSAFSGDHILGAILFKATMDRQIEGLDTADYLWERKNIVPFLKVDDGLADEVGGVQLMKPMPELNELLERAVDKHIFGTKMRSVIKQHNPEGIKQVVQQQFDVARQILAAGLVPIIEPEVDIHAEAKADIEQTLQHELAENLSSIPEGQVVMFKLTPPDQDNLYEAFTTHPRVLKVVFLSGGYPRAEANARLSRNRGVVASFSRVLVDGLSVDQAPADFDATLKATIESVYEASRA